MKVQGHRQKCDRQKKEIEGVFSVGPWFSWAFLQRMREFLRALEHGGDWREKIEKSLHLKCHMV